MAVNCFRFFGMTDWNQIDQLTLKQYRIMMRALELKQVDEEFKAHRQAYLNQVVKAEKQIGKSSRAVYDSFDKFFDYEARLQSVINPKAPQKIQKSQSIAERLAELKKKRKEGVK